MVLSIDGYRQLFIYTKDTIYHYFLALRLYIIAMAELLNLVIIKLLNLVIIGLLNLVTTKLLNLIMIKLL